jgi:hypothetical protein
MSREIITVDNALVRSRGKWLSTHVGTYHDTVTMALAIKRAGKITSVRQIVRAQYGRVTDCMEIYVRGRVWKSVNLLLEADKPAYPIYDKNGHHKVIGLKVIAYYNATDLTALTAYLDACVERNEITLAKVNLLKHIVEALRKSGNGNGNGNGNEK